MANYMNSRAEAWTRFYAALASRVNFIPAYHSGVADAMLVEFDKRYRLREYSREFMAPHTELEERPKDAKP